MQSQASNLPTKSSNFKGQHGKFSAVSTILPQKPPANQNFNFNQTLAHDVHFGSTNKYNVQQKISLVLMQNNGRYEYISQLERYLLPPLSINWKQLFTMRNLNPTRTQYKNVTYNFTCNVRIFTFKIRYFLFDIEHFYKKIPVIRNQALM